MSPAVVIETILCRFSKCVYVFVLTFPRNVIPPSEGDRWILKRAPEHIPHYSTWCKNPRHNPLARPGGKGGMTLRDTYFVDTMILKRLRDLPSS